MMKGRLLPHIRRVRQALTLDGEPELIRPLRSAGHSLDDDGR
jgi:hypothetical protein